ncbi:MAG: hypothetical protein SH848_05820 [Saprospiraceae bacterium]|nr:hypothetical protein [Saprospiraceae bacterium]MDZ4703425.1 hypothetical protein [Saprospiraceae bacterium]
MLKATSAALENTMNIGGTLVSNLDPKYGVTKDDLKKMASGSITGIRVVISKKNYDVEVKPKQSKKIQQALNCFMKDI